MSMLGIKLRESVKSNGIDLTIKALADLRSERKVKQEDISLREMAQSFMGDSWAESLTRYNTRCAAAGGVLLREAVDGVEASAFSAITGQLLVDQVREKYDYAVRSMENMFTVESVGQNLEAHRVPRLTRVRDGGKNVNQLQPYPVTGFDPDYIDYPAPQKFGEICYVGMEMIRGDRTGQVFESAASTGEAVGMDEYERKLRIALGITNSHSWNGTAYDTYRTTGWINLKDDFVLVDWQDVNKIEQLFAQMTDPTTGKNIIVGDMQAFVTPALKHTARRIFSATETRTGTTSSVPGNATIAGNPLDSYSLNVCPHARRILIAEGGLTAAKADTFTLWGNFKKAFRWRQVYATMVSQLPPGNILEFTQDVALAIKAGGFGVACVYDPRYVAKAYNNAA